MMTVDPTVYIIPSLPASDGFHKRSRLEVESVSSDVIYCNVPEDVELVASKSKGIDTLHDLIVNDMQPVEPSTRVVCGAGRPTARYA
jgi:hypothetical protein